MITYNIDTRHSILQKCYIPNEKIIYLRFNEIDDFIIIIHNLNELQML